MKKILLQVTFLTLLMPAILFAQDAHFSQFFNNQLMINPALAGNGIEYIRVTAIYRNQWAGMGTPFTTQGIAVDKVVNRIGIGAAMTRNSAGDASMRTLNFVGNLAYHLPLGAEKINTLSGGIQLGIVNKSFDPSKLTFDNQYNPDAGYDPTMGSGEDFTTTSVTRPDVNVGLVWQRGWLNKEVKFKPFAGISYSHLTKPDETFIMEVTKVHRKRTVYGGAGFMLNSGFEIRPSVMLLNQGPSKETTFGSLINYQLDNKNAVQLGVYNRMNDAVIAYAGYQMNLLFVGMSYDVNTSELSKSGKGNNAFEISLTYSPRPRRKKEPDIKPPVEKPQRATEISLMEIIETPVVSIYVPASLTAPELIITAKETNVKPIASYIKTKTPEKIAEVISVPEKQAKEIAVVPEVKAAANKPAAKMIEPAVIKDFDKDGVVDAEDECPYIKGAKKSNGCPDSDGDGMIDMKDKCPMETGTIANNGCPDVTAPAAGNQELVKKFDNILFAPGLIRLTTDDIFDIIERAIDIMYADKSTKVILSGHTDSEGDEYQNMILSQARTEVVKRYMINQGIDASRIQTVAYGESMPLQNNLFKEGMKLNRRVEINILKK